MLDRLDKLKSPERKEERSRTIFKLLTSLLLLPNAAFLSAIPKVDKEEKEASMLQFSFLLAQMFVLVITMYENGSFHFNSLGGHGGQPLP